MAGSDPKRRPRQLSARDIRFCRLYAERGRGHALECWTEAGFRPRQTRDASYAAVHLLLSNPQISAKIQDFRDAASAAEQVTIEDLARGFRSAEQADPTRLMGPDGEMLPPSEWPADVKRHITRLEVEELTEMQADPDNPRRKKKVAIGIKWKVWLENKTECRKVLAGWKRMIGAEKADEEKAKPDPMVVGGKADPGKL